MPQCAQYDVHRLQRHVILTVDVDTDKSCMLAQMGLSARAVERPARLVVLFLEDGKQPRQCCAGQHLLSPSVFVHLFGLAAMFRYERAEV